MTLTDTDDAGRRITEALELRAVRAEVAHDRGIPPRHRHRLVGETRAELEADADQLLIDTRPRPADPAHMPYVPVRQS